MKIVNPTGNAADTRILDDEGNDITDKLRATRIQIDIKAGDRSRAIIYCHPDQIDIVGNEGALDAPAS
jgi:hypothetical protein